MTSLPCCLIFSSTGRTMVAALYGTTAVLAYVLSAARLAHGRRHAAPPSHGGRRRGCRRGRAPPPCRGRVRGRARLLGTQRR